MRLLKRVFAIIVSGLFISRLPFAKLVDAIRSEIDRPPISISDILTIQRTVFSLSSNGLVILGEMPSQTHPMPLEVIYMDLLARSLAGVHLLLFWGLGHRAREPYVRAFLWCLSGLFGGIWRRVRSRWRPKVDTDLENAIVPYHGPALPLGPLRSSTSKNATLPSPEAPSFDSGVDTGSIHSNPSDANPSSSTPGEDPSSEPPHFFTSNKDRSTASPRDLNTSSESPRFLTSRKDRLSVLPRDLDPSSGPHRFWTSSKDRSTAPPLFSTPEVRPQPPPYSKRDLPRHATSPPT